MATTRWGGLRLEPYNPNAVDADGDGIVQEGTAWERPGGTRLIDELGREIRTGITSAQRPSKMRVQRDGKNIDYTPTYGKGTPTPEAPEGKPTALAKAGAPSLQERGMPTLKSMLGTIGEPLQSQQPSLTPEQIQAGWDIFEKPNPRLFGQLSSQDLAEAGMFSRMLKKALTKVDEPEERLRISNMLFNSFYWGTVAFNSSGGSIGAVINDIWYSAQDSGFSPHELLEEMWRAGGSFAITIPMMRLKEKFKLTKKEVGEFASGVREYMRRKQIQAGQFNEKFKNSIRSVFKSLREDNNLPGVEFDLEGTLGLINFSVNKPMMPALSVQRHFPIIDTIESPEPPEYPRIPPASAFTGKAAEIFGSAKSWEQFWELMGEHEIVFLDYETTGLEKDINGRVTSNGLPTQIGAVRMKGGEVLDKFNIYINPGRQYSEWTKWSQENLKDQDGNLITQEFLEDKPGIAQAHQMLVDWIGPDAIMGAQNVIFDEEVLTRSLQESRIDWKPAGWLDTKEIADMALPRWSEDNQDAPFKVDANGKKSPSNRLNDITKYLGVQLGANHHTADYDAVAAGEVLNRIVRGGIEKGWSADVLDPAKRLVKEKKNQDDFAQAIEAFNEQVDEYNKKVKPSFTSIEDILDFESLVGKDKDDWHLDWVADDVRDDWNQWDPCREIRSEAYHVAGLAVNPADPNITRTGGYWGNGAGPSYPTTLDDLDKRYEQAKYLMGSLAKAVHGSADTDRPTLFRAMTIDGADADGFWGAVQVGEEIDIPLLAFADRRRQGDNEFLSDYGKDVLIVLDDSPGSVEIARFPPMWSQNEEDRSLDDLLILSDQLEEMDEDEADVSFAVEIRELINEYRTTSIRNAQRRQELRDELTSIASDFGIPVDWAGDDVEGDNAWNLEEHALYSPRERISGGRMEVVSIEDDPDGMYGKVVRLRQVGVFDPQIPGRLVKRKL